MFVQQVERVEDLGWLKCFEYANRQAQRLDPERRSQDW